MSKPTQRRKDSQNAEPPVAVSSLNWHAMDGLSITHSLNVEPDVGVPNADVLRRREHYGANTIATVKPVSVLRLLVHQFTSVVVALLAAAAIVSWATADHLEAFTILVVLVINSLVGFLTEWQANRTLEALRRQTRTSVRTRRDGVEKMFDAEELVCGDIIILNAGDRVPADARLLEASRVQTEESALTGESNTVEKDTQPVPIQTPLAERRSMIYLGTAITSGRAVAVVVATGPQTELGRVGQLVAASRKERSPLEINLDQLGRRLVYIVLGIALIVIFAGWLRGVPLAMMVEVGISLAVAAVPEGLPAVTTLILALGLLRMSKQRAIMRRLSAVETLGSTTVICTDKTGTLTENQMVVREYYLSDGRTIKVDQRQVSAADDVLLQRALRIGILCNEAAFQIDGNREAVTIGDPTEMALLVVADALVLDVAGERAMHPKLAEQPFHSTTKRMTTLHRKRDGQHFAALKGAPAVVLDACSYYADGPASSHPLDEAARERFEKANESMANHALRVLALAVKTFDGNVDYPSEADLENDYTFIGFVGMIDPPRPRVATAIQQAREAGIRTVMLTGDQLNTGRAIARELGLGGKEPNALHARDLAGASQDKLAQLARNVDVFARVSPEDKLRIVEALQEEGEVVAVTGDGVNDAPALKRANIGIAMGLRGSEVAKEAADVVLADDNFSTIVDAVEGGRAIYANIRKFVHMMFSHNLGEVITIFVAIAIGWPLPLLPLQILWMNLVTDVFPALALALDPPSAQLMKRPPRDPNERLFSGSLIITIAWQATMIATLALAAYWWALGRYGAGAHAQTVALLALIGSQQGHVFNCRSRTRSVFIGLFDNPFIWLASVIVLGLQLLSVYFSPLSLVLRTTRPLPIDWIFIVACILTPIAIVELSKIPLRRREVKHPAY